MLGAYTLNIAVFTSQVTGFGEAVAALPVLCNRQRRRGQSPRSGRLVVGVRSCRDEGTGQPPRRNPRRGPRTGAGLDCHRLTPPDRNRQVTATERTVRVMVADDQDLIRTGLRMILQAQPAPSVVGCA